MGNLFWKKTTKNLQSKITNQDRAVLQLKQQRDKLQQYQKQVIAQLERDREVAILLLRDGRKDRAKLMLKKKKFQESLLDKTHVQLDNLAKLVHDLEFAQIEVEVVKGLEVCMQFSFYSIAEIISITNFLVTCIYRYVCFSWWYDLYFPCMDDISNCGKHT